MKVTKANITRVLGGKDRMSTWLRSRQIRGWGEWTAGPIVNVIPDSSDLNVCWNTSSGDSRRGEELHEHTRKCLLTLLPVLEKHFDAAYHEHDYTPAPNGFVQYIRVREKQAGQKEAPRDAQ